MAGSSITGAVAAAPSNPSSDADSPRASQALGLDAAPWKMAGKSVPKMKVMRVKIINQGGPKEGYYFFSAAGFGWFYAFLLLCCSASLLFCFFACVLFCFSAFPASLLVNFYAFLLFVFPAFCFSCFCDSLLYQYLLLFFSASLLSLLLCFSVFCFFCFCAFLLLLLCFFFSSVMCFCCSTSCSSASLLPVFTASLFFLFFCFILSRLYPNETLKTLAETQRNPKEILIRTPDKKPLHETLHETLNEP